MQRIPWILTGLLLTRLPFVEAAAPLSPAPVAARPPLGAAGQARWPTTVDLNPGYNTWLGIVPQDVGTTYYHKGEDFGAVPDLLPVFAPEAGRVTTAQDSVQLRAPDGTLTRLFHMNPPMVVAAGQSLAAGQRLGLTGKFGNSDADPHLHYEFCRDGDEPGTYPFAVDAYLRDYPDAGVAIAGGYQFMWAGETLVLDGGRSRARPGRTITGYRWILHDGTAVDGATAKLTIATPGFYAQELRVFFDDGREERGFTPVRVFAPGSSGQEPVPGFVHQHPVRGIVPGDPVTIWHHPFILASHERTIDFGDGSPVRTVSGSRPSVAHTYAAPGPYTVTVTTVAGLPQILKSSVLVEPADIHQPWPMHHVCRDFLIANSLNATDVDGDGLDDYSVIDERRGLMTIIFHPDKSGDVRHEWPRLILGETSNPEYACLGDLDGDGAPDFITVEGDDLSRGVKTGVRIFWSPGQTRAHEATAWKDGGRIPGTEDNQFLYAECHDVNGDGALDLVVGGRKHPITKQYAGIRWLRAPADRKARRDLSKWTTHFLDADTPSGHGFVFADINGDGQPDLVDANADWDTPRHEQELYWYENPGASKPAQLRPWPRHSIWKSTEFYAKPQTAIGDYDGDGLPDIATQTQNFIHFFRCQSCAPVAWQHVRAMKPDWIQWLGRPVKFADLNGDGRLDLVGALIHNDGNLPKDKASVFWLENNGGSPDSWKVHPIKWSDGANTRDPWIGEKWDHLLSLDVDGDGDLDLLGNVEEHYRRGPDGKDVSWFSVVWFENPLRHP